MTTSTRGKPVLSVQDIVKGFGSQPVLQGISLTLHEGERVGLIGRNGSGKSTLLKIMAGQDVPDDGVVTRTQGLRVDMLEQQCRLDLTQTVAQVLDHSGEELRHMLEAYRHVTEQLARAPVGHPDHDSLAARAGELQHVLEVEDGWNQAHHVQRIAQVLGVPAPDRVLSTLSGGELRRVDLAARILERPDLLLLDEPTNHLDTGSVEWIERYLERYEGSCVLVTHDRYFLDRVVHRIVELEGDRLFNFAGSYEDFLEQKMTVLETELRAESNRQALLRRELAWLRRGAKARTTKQKARIKRYDELAAQDPITTHREFEFAIPEPRRLSKRILELSQVSLTLGGRNLFEGFSFFLQEGMRVGIIGPNGSGKTSLLRILMGEQEFTKGKRYVGEGTQFLYVDQDHEAINPNVTILQHVSNGLQYWDVGERRIYVPSYLEKFLFDSGAVNTPMGNLSGGERNRIDLAKKLLRGGNVLMLDEPTNDLDLQTLRVLEEAILNFNGCALMVSHDRYFLNRLCTHLLVFDGEGTIHSIVGNYDDYLLFRDRLPAKGLEEDVKAAKERPRRRESLRLSYGEQKELESMEAAILRAEGEVQRLEGIIHSADFYQRPHTEVQDVLQEFHDVKVRIETLYARWDELDQRKSGVPAGNE
jgi:ABC transport system ATP-binding/permease protein